MRVLKEEVISSAPKSQAARLKGDLNSVRGSPATGAIIFVLLISSAAGQSLANGSAIAFAPSGSTADPPTLVLSPNTGPVGTLITATGAGYPASTTLTICFGTSPAGCSGASLVTSDGSGAISTTVTVPEVAPGVYYVDVLSGAVLAFAAFGLTPETLAISPGIAAIGSSITVTGSNYAASTIYTLCFATVTFSCNISGAFFSVTSNVRGAISSVEPVPQVAPGGYFVDVAFGSTFLAAAALAITPETLTLSPNTGPVGTTITLSGSNYASSTSYAYCFSTSPNSCSGASLPLTTTAGGTLPAGTTVTVPEVVGGGYFVDVFAFGVSGVIASAAFSATPETIALAPNNGAVGTVVTVTGSNYAASTVYTLCFATVTNSCNITGASQSVLTTPGGAIPGGTTIAVPQVIGGGYFVDVASSSTFLASAAFTVTPETLTLSPNTGPVGTTITLSGSNYASSTSYAYCFSTSPNSCSGASLPLTTTAGGTLPAGTTVTVPEVVGGGYFVDVFAFGVSGVIASAAFSATPETIALAPNNGAVSTSITVTGSNYAASTVYTLCFSTSPFACTSGPGSASKPITTGGGGTIPPATTVTVPAGASGTEYVNMEFGSTILSSSPFSVGGSALPTLQLSPNIGPVRSTVSITGNNYPASTIFALCFSSFSTGCSGGASSATSDGSGSISTSIAVPQVASGGYFVNILLSGALLASAAFSVTPETLSVSPNAGPVGTSLAIAGSNYGATTIYTVCFSLSNNFCNGAGPPQMTATDASGGLSTTVTVPEVAPAGYFVDVFPLGLTNVVSAAFGLTPETLALSPNTGAIGTAITLTGSNYAASTSYTLCFSTSPSGCSAGTSTAITTGGGALPAGTTVTVPQVTSGGYFVNIASGSTVLASDSFTSVPETLALSPNSGTLGSSISVVGSNYAHTTTYTVCFSLSNNFCNGAGPPQTATTDANGGISTTVTVPEVAPAGYFVDVFPFGLSNVLASAPYGLTPESEPLSPNIAPVGTSVSVTGSNYAHGTTYTICFSTLSSGCSGTTVSATSDGSGGLSASVTVPEVPPGGYFINVLFSSTPLTSDAFDLTPESLALSPNTGLIGTSVSVTGSNYAHSTAYTICYSLFNDRCSGSAGLVSSGVGGDMSATILVPTGAYGLDYVNILFGSTVLASASFGVSVGIILSPAAGTPGTIVTVSGSGFAPGSTITIQYDGLPVITSPSTVTSSSTSPATFAATFTAPPGSAGPHSVSATDTSTNSASATFTLQVVSTTTTTTTISGLTSATTTQTVTQTSTSTLTTPTTTTQTNTVTTTVTTPTTVTITTTPPAATTQTVTITQTTTITTPTTTMLTSTLTATSTLTTTQTVTTTTTVGSATSLSPTSASLDCRPDDVRVGAKTTCTAVIRASSRFPPGGVVTFASGSRGTFGEVNCGNDEEGNSLTCTVKYSPGKTEPQAITATYPGDQTHSGSVATFELNVHNHEDDSVAVLAPHPMLPLPSSDSLLWAFVYGTLLATLRKRGRLFFTLTGEG